MCIDTPSAKSACHSCIITVNEDRFENRFTLDHGLLIYLQKMNALHIDTASTKLLWYK